MKTLALVTDFGTRDYFVGVMKGVVKKIDPEIEIIDVSHDIPSYNILAASFVVQQVHAYFPPNTVFLAVVDPGVGTRRKILLADSGGYRFIAPDNGLLTPILRGGPTNTPVRAREISNRSFFLTDGPSTFEARDRMSPAAAHLLKGADPAEFGSETSDYILNPHYFPQKHPSSIEGRVVYIDKFGNMITNVSRKFLDDALENSGFSQFFLEIKGKGIRIEEFYPTYALAKHNPFLLTGSHQNIEIAMNKDSAARFLDISPGREFVIQFY